MLKCKKPTQQRVGSGYTWQQSSATCRVNRIKGFMYGPFSARFWMLRKHINSISFEKFVKGEVPFYSWQCITINMENRDVDLVIPKEKDMEMLLTFLIFELKTTNGEKGTAKQYLGHLPWVKKEKILRKILVGYKKMKWRMKISCIALEKRKTIAELFLEQIIKTYYTFFQKGKIAMTIPDLYKQQDEVFYKILFLPSKKAIQYVISINQDKDL